jgi:hypothetical protein
LKTIRAIVQEELERTQLKMLAAFHSWATPMETCVRRHSIALDALDNAVNSIAEQLVNGRAIGSKAG